jgi:hypothetical protein
VSFLYLGIEEKEFAAILTSSTKSSIVAQFDLIGWLKSRAMFYCWVDSYKEEKNLDVSCNVEILKMNKTCLV